MTCPDPNTLAALDSLGDDERAAIVDHAAGCDSCRGVVFAVVATTAGTGTPPPSTSEADPATIDRYRVERRIGVGAMGMVFAAYDPELDRRVAVKLMRAGGSADRLRREAQVLAKLTHPNVVAVYDAGAFGDGTFIAMALVDGENLRAWLREPRTLAEVIAAIVQAARGVIVAHAAGIVHRDIKPDNIFVGRSGEVLVGDFGLARPGGERATAIGIEDSNELTQTGAIVGTPAYMAPEQIAGEATQASDQFSLCVTAWEALYGARPFQGGTLQELAAAIRRGPPGEPKPGVPAHVVAAIRKGLAADPAERHASVAVLLAALEHRRRRWPVLAGAAVVAVAASTIAVVATRSPALDPEAEALAVCAALPAMTQPQVTPTGPLAGDIEMRISGYVKRWTAVRDELCAANARHELPDPSYAAAGRCLERRAKTFAILGEPFAKADPFDVVILSEQLEEPSDCRNAQPGPVPSEALAELQADVDRFGLLRRVGALSLIAPAALIARADALADPATSAEVLFVAGATLFARNRADAEATLLRAGKLAEEARDDRTRTRVTAMLAEVLARASRTAEAAVQRDVASSAAPRAGDAISQIAAAHASAMVARAQHDNEAEIAGLRRVVELQRARVGVSFALMLAVHDLSYALQRIADPRSREAIAEGRLLAERMQLPADGRAAIDPLDFPAAVEVAERAVAEARGERSPRLGQLLVDLGYAYDNFGDIQRSLDAH
ncbi:MAG: serine/threonine-protein kinase, partial [Kofleriaceae bacterium]